MRVANNPMIAPETTVVVTTVYNSKAVWLGHICNYAIQAVFSASNCTFKLQGSCDEGDANGQSQLEYEARVVNWSDLAATALVSTGAGNVIYNLEDAGYNWVRLVCTGTATITSMRYNVKGI